MKWNWYNKVIILEEIWDTLVCFFFINIPKWRETDFMHCSHIKWSKKCEIVVIHIISNLSSLGIWAKVIHFGQWWWWVVGCWWWTEFVWHSTQQTDKAIRPTNVTNKTWKMVHTEIICMIDFNQSIYNHSYTSHTSIHASKWNQF